MLRKILDNKRCGECKLCCKFDEYDVWEAPVLTESDVDGIKACRPEAEFLKWDGIYRFKIVPPENGELWECPALSANGCALGENKPFECAVWPFRVMEIGGERFICAADFCEPIIEKTLKELTDFFV